MKKLFLSALLGSGLLIAGSVSADQPQPAGCSLQFSVHSEDIIIINTGSGTGVVTCSDTQSTRTARVNIQISGIGLGLGEFNVQGVAGGIGIANPEDLAGTYGVASVDAGFGVAVGAGLGFEGQTNGLTFTGNVQGGQGIGAALNGTTWTITPAR